MKKLLVLVVTVAMLLSIAAVSLGAVTTTADFRYEIISQSNNTDKSGPVSAQSKTTDNADFRVKFAGKVSDNIDASYMIRMQSSGKPSNTGSVVYADEYFMNFKYPFVTVKVGAFDYKVHPSRQLGKACANNIFVERNPTLTTFDIPIGDTGFYTGGAYVIDGSSAVLRDNAWDVKAGYRGSKQFGVELHYYETAAFSANKALLSTFDVDAWYNVTNTFKVYVFGTDPRYKNSPKAAANEQYQEEYWLGLLFDKIAGKKASVAIEYCVNNREEEGTFYSAKTGKTGIVRTGATAEWDENPYAVLAKYAFNNGLALEYELTNQNYGNDTKNLLRFRVQF